MNFVPVYTKDGNEFILPYSGQLFDTEDEAWKVGLGTSLVEGVLDGYRHHRTMEIDPDNLPHIKARLGAADVCIIAGPLFGG